MPLRLRPFTVTDETAAVSAHAAMKDDGFRFLLGWDERRDWRGYLEELERHRRGLDLAADLVPSAMLAADVDGQLVGRVSVRFALSEVPSRGGHIGYCVLARFRRRGYATEMLRQALVIARSEGVGRVLVVCDDDNLASAATIERCGGVLESVVEASAHDVAFRRYWID